jgi:inner membrane protein
MSFFHDLGLAPHWWWLIAAALLAILEIFLPGIFLVWIAIAAAATGIAVLLLPDLGFPAQAIVFAILAFVAVFAGRLYYARNPVPTSDDKLNERASRLIGQRVMVETAIENGKGRVRVGDGVWNARGPDLPAGASATIVAADGTLLTVEAA